MTAQQRKLIHLAAAVRRLGPLIALALSVACCAATAEKILTIGTPILTPNGSNPYQALGYPATLALSAVFDPLTVIDVDGRVQPWLAVDWSTGDSVRWLIRLRDGVVFSNGRQLDANVLVESVQHMKSLAGRAETVGSNLADIERIEVISEREALVILEAPDPVFPVRLSLWRVPEPATFKEAARNGHQTFAAGTGPFKPVARSPDRISLVASAGSWRAPILARLVLIQIADQLARSQALASGDIDVALEIGVGGKRHLDNLNARLIARRIRLMPYIGFAVEHVDSTPLADQRVRQALNYAVNKRLIADILFDGLVAPIGQLALPGAVGYDPTLEPYEYDPDRARRLLSEAGYPEGFDVTFRMSANEADAITYAQQIAADLAAVKVRAKLQLAPGPQMTLMLFHGKLKAELFSSSGARGLAPARDYRFRACLGLVGRFKPFFCDDVASGFVAQARASATYEEMDRAMRAALRREHENPPVIFLWDGRAFDGVAGHVRSFEFDIDFIRLHKVDVLRD